MTSPRDIADEELNECLARIQKRIGVEYGDFASIYFSGISKESKGYEAAVQMLTTYIIAENKFGCKRICASQPS